MYHDALLDGSALPDHTLCLTFDDGPGETTGPGPGPRTVELAQYLATQGIAGTFFMVGKYASDLPGIMETVESFGHLVANHSYDHPNLVELAGLGGDAVCQISRTDGLVRNWIDAPVVYVRPPYGSWDAGIASSLNANLTATLSHVGPVGWDIDGGDWACWKDGRPVANCVADYLAAINAKRRGIVLMHDCTADQDVVKQGNRTLELVQQLIPALRQQGYNFVRLDFVPGVTRGDESAIRIAMRGANGLYVSPQGGGGGAVIVNGPGVGPWEPLVVEDLYVGKVALRTTTRQYISPQLGGGGDVLANGPGIGPWEPLDLISLGNNQVAFRTVTGHFLDLNTGMGDVLDARGAWLNLQPTSIFTYEYL